MNINKSFCFSEGSLDIIRVESMLIEIRWELFQQMNGEIQHYRVSFLSNKSERLMKEYIHTVFLYIYVRIWIRSRFR